MLALEAAVDAYLVHLEVERNLSPKTREAYGQDLAFFLRWLAGRKASLLELEASDVEAWLYALANAGQSARSQARRLISLRGFFKYWVREGALARSPTERVPLPKVGRALPESIGADAVLLILKAATQVRDRALVFLLYGCGLRVSELVGLQRADLDLDAQRLTVLGKGNKQRRVPLGRAIAEVLEAHLSDLDADRRRRGLPPMALIFPGRDGQKPLTRQAVFKILRRLAREAGVSDKVSPHKLRHSFATDLLRGGADLRSVQMLLGHADLRTTEVYTHVDDQWVRDTYMRTHPRSRT